MKIQRKITRKYNWKPDLPDPRDYLFSIRAGPPIKVPSKIDLRDRCSPVVNQGEIGSCTANALAGMFEFLELRELQAKQNKAPEVFGQSFEPVSRLFIYYNERVLERKVLEDSGATLRDGIKILNKLGTCRESLWAYHDVNLFQKPSDKAYAEAVKHKVSEYSKISSLDEMKQCLASGFPFAFGFLVYESFESQDVARTGVMPMPQPIERALGGHAVLAVGYDDDRDMLIVRNSWGAEWGDHGYFYMPYAYVQNRQLSLDFWTVRK